MNTEVATTETVTRIECTFVTYFRCQHHWDRLHSTNKHRHKNNTVIHVFHYRTCTFQKITNATTETNTNTNKKQKQNSMNKCNSGSANNDKNSKTTTTTQQQQQLSFSLSPGQHVNLSEGCILCHQNDNVQKTFKIM